MIKIRETSENTQNLVIFGVVLQPNLGRHFFQGRPNA